MASAATTTTKGITGRNYYEQSSIILDVLTSAGIDRFLFFYLHLKDVARLARTSQRLNQSISLHWMLDREWLLQLKCPPLMLTKILEHEGLMHVSAWSNTAPQPAEGSTIWEALQPLFQSTPLKRCYGLSFQITLLPSSNTGNSLVSTNSEFQFRLQFSNQVLCHSNDITVFESGYYSATNFPQRPRALHCMCGSHCFGKNKNNIRKFHFVTGRYCEGGYYCHACLEQNGFVKLRKIQAGDPGAQAIWNGCAYKLA